MSRDLHLLSTLPQLIANVDGKSMYVSMLMFLFIFAFYVNDLHIFLCFKHILPEVYLDTVVK